MNICHNILKEKTGNLIDQIYYSPYHPSFSESLTRKPETLMLEKARDIAMSCGLEYVYIGNVPSHEAWNTFCPNCKKIIIQRIGYMIGEMHLNKGKCNFCGKPISGIWACLFVLEDDATFEACPFASSFFKAFCAALLSSTSGGTLNLYNVAGSLDKVGCDAKF